MHRSLLTFSTVAVALVALAAFAAPASAATPGTFSIGGNFGTGIYSNSDLNDANEPLGFEKVTSGWEYGGSLRYQVSPKMALDLEANFMKPMSTTEDAAGDIEVTTAGMAIPLNLYYQLSQNETSVFNLFGGAGIVTGAKYKEEQEGSAAFEADGKSSFYGQAGLEAQYMVSQSFAFGARALGRMAKSEIEDPILNGVEIDYSGFAFSLGARMMFGGGGDE